MLASQMLLCDLSLSINTVQVPSVPSIFDQRSANPRPKHDLYNHRYNNSTTSNNCNCHSHHVRQLSFSQVTTNESRVETLTVQVDVTSTTSLYPSPIKRGEGEARSVFIPSFLSDFAPYQLSSGCSCFITPLPTPTYTVVAETLIFTYKHATVRILFRFLIFQSKISP
jgi:hypothetical protein